MKIPDAPYQCSICGKKYESISEVYFLCYEDRMDPICFNCERKAVKEVSSWTK